MGGFSYVTSTLHYIHTVGYCWALSWVQFGLDSGLRFRYRFSFGLGGNLTNHQMEAAVQTGITFFMKLRNRLTSVRSERSPSHINLIIKCATRVEAVHGSLVDRGVSGVDSVT